MKKLMILSCILMAWAFSALAEDVAPSYPGGSEAMVKFISENMKYPVVAFENGIEGVVEVGAVIQSDGVISDVKVVRMLDPDLEEEAVRIVKLMPAWIPGTKDGVAVSMPIVIAVSFVLE